MDSMPMTVANTISLNFVSHQDIIDMLCYNILPFTLYRKLLLKIIMRIVAYDLIV